MSTRDARKFITDLVSSTELVEKIGALAPADEGEGAGAYYARHCQELGYSFTAEEYEAGLCQVRAAAKGVIMEEELSDLAAE